MNDSNVSREKRWKRRSERKDLWNSCYQWQRNDYVILTIPSGHPTSGQTFPCNVKLAPIVQMLWDQKFVTYGQDQTSAFISLAPFTTDRQPCLLAFAQLLERFPLNVMILQGKQQQTKKNNKYPTVTLKEYYHFVRWQFHPRCLPYLYAVFKLENILPDQVSEEDFIEQVMSPHTIFNNLSKSTESVFYGRRKYSNRSHTVQRQ